VSSQEQSLGSELSSTGHPDPPEAAGTKSIGKYTVRHTQTSNAKTHKKATAIR